MSEGKSLIYKNNASKIRFDEKMENTGNNNFLFTTNIYRKLNYTAIFVPKNHSLEGNAATNKEGTEVNKR